MSPSDAIYELKMYKNAFATNALLRIAFREPTPRAFSQMNGAVSRPEGKVKVLLKKSG